jgi:hypothetical protein
MLKWYPDKSDSYTKWPHDVLDSGLAITGEVGIKKSASTVKSFDLEEINGRLDLPNELERSLQSSWDRLKLSLRVSIKSDSEDIEDVCKSKEDVDVALFINNSKTAYQISKIVSLELPYTDLEFEIDRENLYGDIKLQAFYLLNKDYGEDAFLAYKSGSVIGQSEEQLIIADYIGNLFGGKIMELFERFGNENKNALYQFKFDENDYPVITYNTRFSSFVNLIKAKTKEGHPNTLFRDFLAKMMISQIYYDMSCRLPKDRDDNYEPSSLNYNIAKALGKNIKIKKLNDILDVFADNHDLSSDDKNNSLFQHSVKLGPALEKALDGSKED